MMVSIPSPALERVFLHRQAPNTQPVPWRIGHRQVRAELMLGGRGWVETQEGWQELRAGDLLWNRPGDFTIGRSDPNAPYSCLAVDFLYRGPVPALPRLSSAPDPEAAASLAEEALHWASQESFDRAVLGHYLHARLRFWIELSRQRHRAEQMPAPIRQVLALMEADWARPWRVPELARRAGWSAAHLHDVFRAHVGLTPHQWLLRRRLRAARERLVSTPDPIKRIAVECGFADSAALAHAFRAHYGISPKTHREHHLRVLGRSRSLG